MERSRVEVIGILECSEGRERNEILGGNVEGLSVSLPQIGLSAWPASFRLPSHLQSWCVDDLIPIREARLQAIDDFRFEAAHMIRRFVS
jgi:hypothetical protein